MAETTRTPEQQQEERQRQERERTQAATRNVPRPADRPHAEGERERDEADKQIAEHLGKPPETPVPTQEEADEIRERALAGGRPREGRQERDVKPADRGPGYTTR
jgi:hypothetical protein